MKSRVHSPQLSKSDACSLDRADQPDGEGRFGWRTVAAVCVLVALAAAGAKWYWDHEIMSREEASIATASLVETKDRISIECGPTSGDSRLCVVSYREFDLKAPVTVPAGAYPEAKFTLRYNPSVSSGIFYLREETLLKAHLDFESISRADAVGWVRATSASALGAAELQIKDQLAAARTKRSIADSYRD